MLFPTLPIPGRKCLVKSILTPSPPSAIFRARFPSFRPNTSGNIAMGHWWEMGHKMMRCMLHKLNGWLGGSLVVEQSIC